MEYLYIWLAIAVIALVVDISTSNLFFVCFTIGGIGAIITLMLNGNIAVQVITFSVVSGIAIAVLYPLSKKYIKKTIPKTLTREEGYIGRNIVIDVDILDRAKIKIDGIYWTVKNEGPKVIEGDIIEITGIEGNKLIIKKI